MDLKSKVICLYLLILYLQYVEACLTKTDGDGNSNTGTTQSQSGSTDVCNTQETNTQRCLNTGTCYVTILGSRSTHCRCPPDYEGTTCDIKHVPLTGASVQDTAAIVGIVIGILALISILAGIVFLMIRKLQKDGRPKLGIPKYPEEIPEIKLQQSNYSASRHYHSNQRTFSNFAPGISNLGYSYDVSSNPNPTPFTISGSMSTPSKRSGVTMVDSDEKDNQSLRPPSSSGGSLLHNSGSLGPIKVPLAFHETGV